MKQRKFGQKVQNWHRPLPATALSQRYLRLRQQTETEDYQDDWYDGDDDYRRWCDCCDPREEPYLSYRLTELLSRITTPLNPLLSLKGMAIRRPDSDACGSEFNRAGSNSVPLEQRLAEHVKDFLGNWENDAIRYRIIKATGDPRNLSVLNRVAANNEISGVVKLICFFSPFWVRPPMTWKEDSGVSLLDHIFVLYDAPDFLFAEWRNQAQSKTVSLKWLCWFILLAQGGSLKRAASVFNWNISDGFQHHLWTVSSKLSPTEACILAEVRRSGGDERDFRRICSYESYVIDPTVGAEHKYHSVFFNARSAVDIHFWQETVRWLIANREALEDTDCFEILSWAMHEHTEAQQQLPLQAFSWKGRSVRAAIERSLEYRRRIERPYESYKWSGHNWNWTLDDARSGNWSFVELISSEELFLESAAMRHCVSTYGWRCASGDSAIVSVRRNDKPCLTVEINPATKRAVQVKGAFNREARPEERMAVTSWINTVVRPDIADNA